MKLLLSICAASAVASVGASHRTPNLGEPGTGYEYVEANVRNQLNAAMSELAIGNIDKARAHASVAAVPEHLRFYFESDGMSRDRFEQLREWALSGIQAWQDSGTCTFEEVYSRSDAEVVIRFGDRVQGRIGRYAGFMTLTRNATYGANGITTTFFAEIEISNVAPSGRHTNAFEVRKTVMHEIGHVLGLEDNRNTNDLMGPVASSGETVIDDRLRNALYQTNSRARAILGSATPMTTTNAYQGVPKIFNFR